MLNRDAKNSATCEPLNNTQLTKLVAELDIVDLYMQGCSNTRYANFRKGPKNAPWTRSKKAPEPINTLCPEKK